MSTDEVPTLMLRRLVCVAVVHAALGGAAVAQPDPRLVQAQRDRLAAETCEKGARDDGSPNEYDRCAQLYMVIYERDPSSPQNDEVLYNAAVMFEYAGSIGAATQTFAQLVRQFPRSRIAMKGLIRQAVRFADVAMYDRAAPLLEEYAKKYAGEKDAYDAMGDAVFYRKALGDDAKVIENTKYFVKTFGGKKPQEAASADFALVAIYERRNDRDAAIKQLRSYIRLYGRKGGDAQLVIAHAKLGQLLWDASCPVATIDGLCAKPLRTTKPKLAACGHSVPVALQPVPRKADLVKQALVALTTAVKAFEGARVDDAGARYYAARARLLAIDADAEAALATAPPAPKTAAALGPWLSQEVTLRGKLGSRYEQIFALKDAATSIAAAARLARLADTLAIALYASAATDAECTTIAQQADPLRMRAVEAYGVCAAKSRDLGWYDDAFASCERALLRLAPDDFPPLRERTGRPTNTAPLTATERLPSRR